MRTIIQRLFVSLVVLLLSGTALAQQRLDATFTSDDRSVSFDYPSDWFVQDPGDGMVVLADSLETFENWQRFRKPPQAGQTLVFLFGKSYLDGLTMGHSRELAHFGQIAAVGAALVDHIGTDDPVIPPLDAASPTRFGRLNGIMGQQIASESDPREAAYFILDSGNGIPLGAIAVKASGEMAGFLSTFQAIAGSMTADVQLPPLESAEVVWMQEGALQDVPGGIVIVDGTGYVADGSSGIVVFDLDGTIHPETIGVPAVVNASDLALAGDGTIWVADTSNNAFVERVNPQGEQVQAFGTAGSGEGQFGSLSPQFIEVGGDGKLYTLGKRASGTETPYILEVWQTDGSLDHEAFLPELNHELVRGMALAADGSVTILTAQSGLFVYNAQGELQHANVLRNMLYGSTMTGFDVMDDGTLFLGDDAGNILHVSADGILLGRFSPGIHAATAFAYTDDGDLIVASGTTRGTELLRLHITSPGD